MRTRTLNLTLISAAALFGWLLVPAARSQPAPAEESAPATLDLAELQRAVKELESGEPERARERLERLADHPEANRQVFLSLGRAYSRLGRHPEAVGALVKALRFRENDYEVVIELAETLRRQALAANQEGDYETAGMALEDARRFFEQAGELRPTEAAPWLGASRVAQTLGDPDEALRLVVQATEVDPEHVEAQIELGFQRFGIFWRLKGMEGDEAARDAGELCRRAYARALELDPKNGLAMNGLAWVAMHSDEQEQAIDWFKRSLLADPTLADSYDNLMRLHSDSIEAKKRYVQSLGAVVAAARSFGQGEERRFARAFSLYQRGLAEVAARDVEALRRDFTEAAKVDESFEAACRFQIARGLYRDNQYAEAAGLILAQATDDLTALLDVIASEADGREAVLMIRGLGDKRFRSSELDQARELFRIAAEAQDDSVSDWNNYAFLCRETAHYEESYAAYTRALELDPANPALLNDAALILHYHLHRDLDLARQMYAQAIEEGERILAGGAGEAGEDEAEPDASDRESATIAVRDAKNNLKRLEAGIMSEEPPPRPERPKRRKPADQQPAGE